MSSQTVELEVFARPADAALPPDVLHVERIAMRGMIGHQAAWQDLCDRALERNVFFEPAFALPLFQHVVPMQRPEVLLIWEEGGPAAFSRLVGLLPIRAPGVATPGIVRGFIDPQIRLGTPLLDRDRAPEVLEAILVWLRQTMPKVSALRLQGLQADGPFSRLLAAHCATTGRTVRRFGEHRRAVLQRAEAGMVKIMPFATTKKRKEIGRQRRRLTERGVRTYSSASTPDAIARAAERFLALEHQGWKGRRGTALLADPSLATFTRSMTRLMGHEGKCRIDSIEIDGIAVAMGIILTIDDRAHFWKTTFHEAFRPLSPGVQFALELTERQLADPSVGLTDSCAVPDHPMIDRLWLGRMGVTDVLIELAPDQPTRFARACRLEHIVRGLREVAKGLYRRLRPFANR